VAVREATLSLRSNAATSDAVLDLIASEAAAETDALARERAALERCLGELGVPARELIEAAYQPGVKLHEVAARSGRSAEAFYKTLQRLRSRLLECVQRELKEEPA
jgi:RNA polymerase sigma-70 factor (ECF subfamily)